MCSSIHISDMITKTKIIIICKSKISYFVTSRDRKITNKVKRLPNRAKTCEITRCTSTNVTYVL